MMQDKVGFCNCTGLRNWDSATIGFRHWGSATRLPKLGFRNWDSAIRIPQLGFRHCLDSATFRILQLTIFRKAKSHAGVGWGGWTIAGVELQARPRNLRPEASMTACTSHATCLDRLDASADSATGQAATTGPMKKTWPQHASKSKNRGGWESQF